jgi:hypothetical protein
MNGMKMGRKGKRDEPALASSNISGFPPFLTGQEVGGGDAWQMAFECGFQRAMMLAGGMMGMGTSSVSGMGGLSGIGGVSGMGSLLGMGGSMASMNAMMGMNGSNGMNGGAGMYMITSGNGLGGMSII